MGKISFMYEFREIGVFQSGHFKGSSGRCMECYIDKSPILANPNLVRDICSQIARSFRRDFVDTVIAPAYGGIALSQWTAFLLGEQTNSIVYSTFTEKEEGNHFVREGFTKFIINRKVLVLEDTLTTGETVGKVIEVVRKLKGNVVGVGAIFNRGGVSAKSLKVPFLYSCCDMYHDSEFDTWEEKDCPLHKQGIPINTKFGHGR